MIRCSFILAILFLASCTPIYYAPNSANVPLFSKKNEIAASANFMDNGVDWQGAYAITNNILVSGNAAFFKKEEDTLSPWGRGKFLELGGGYYRPLYEKLSLGATALIALGDTENHYPPSKIEGSFFRCGVQPYVGFRTKFFETALSARFVWLDYYRAKGDLIYDNQDQVQYLNALPTQFFFEPSLVLRFGYKYIFFQMQGIQSFNLTSSHFPYDDGTLTLGLHVKYPFGKKKE